MEEAKGKFAALRQQAAALVPEVDIATETLSREELQRLVEELRIHQVELQLQHQDLLQAHQALEASRDRYAELYDLAPVGYFTIDEDGAIVDVNRTACQMLSVARSDLLGRKLALYVAARDQETYYTCYRQLIIHETPASCEVQFTSAEHSPFWSRLDGVPKPDENGENYAWIAINDITEQKQIDITDRKRMEQEVRQAQTELEGRVAELTYMHAMLIEEAQEREQAQEKVNQRNQELAMLNSTMAAVSSSLELEDVAATLQSALSNEMNIAGGAILFYDPAREQLAMQAQWELPAALVAACNTLPIAGSPLEPVIRDKRTLLHEDLREVPLLLELELDKARPDWRNYLAVPLLAKGEVEGALCLFGDLSAGFSNTQVTFFKILGQQSGIAIQNARLFQQVRRGQQRLRHLAQRVFTAQEKERHRVSRELHDEAGQALTGLKITLEMIRADMDRRTGAIEKSEAGLIQQQLDAAVELCEMTMSQIRTLAHDLRPAALENMGLDMTLRSFCRAFSRRTRLPVTYRYSGVELPDLPSPVDIALYRFLQEALTNVARHAGASQARVEFHCDETTLSLTVEDNGRGFDPEAALEVHNKTQGIGLSGMQERLESVGGRLIVSSRPGGGTRLVAWIPR